MPSTKIRRLHLRGFQQFQDTVLDFTNPETGRAIDRVCLIGRNGTGKSTILRVLDGCLQRLDKIPRHGSRIGLTLEHDKHRLLWLRWGELGRALVDVTDLADEGASLFDGTDQELEHLPKVSPRELGFPLVAGDLLVYSPVDAFENHSARIQDVPSTSLNEALALTRSFPIRHEISESQVAEMWKVLVYLVKRRESDRQAFELRPENLQKTKAQLLEEFDRLNPPVLEGLAELWNRILEPAGLEFDVAGASIPVQLNENLHAYIRHKASGQRIGYAQLSTGIRNFLFRIGHLYLLFFRGDVQRAFVLVDEPENSLFPDFLFDLIETWEEILRRGASTQLFVATHNPIIAAQFEPYERVVLEWDDEGRVTARHGVAPKGDDPNDVLSQDFQLPNLMGPEGRRQWQRYLELRKRLRRANEEDKAQLLAEAAEIGRRYRFGTESP
jgi:energy-coupling factor transporter ATP-binding protein EcfA2